MGLVALVLSCLYRLDSNTMISVCLLLFPFPAVGARLFAESACYFGPREVTRRPHSRDFLRQAHHQPWLDAGEFSSPLLS